jgi:hypothetical protein
MLRLVALLLLVCNALCAAQARRYCSDMARALLVIAEVEGASSTHVGLLDVFGIGVVHHVEGESRALRVRFEGVEGVRRGWGEVTIKSLKSPKSHDIKTASGRC